MNKDFFRQTGELFLFFFWNGLHATEPLWAKVNRPPGPWRENRKMSVQFFTNMVEHFAVNPL